MSQPIECRYYGRDFSAEEMALLRALIAGPPALNRFALSKAFCRRIGWYKPDGGLKDMMARVTMLAMHKDGLIVLPPPKWGRNPAVPMIFGPDTDTPLEPPPETLDEVRPVRLQTVLGGTPQSQQWNAFIARYHYLGYKTLVGAQMRYIVHDRHGRLLALLGFSTAARKLAPRDRFIGWTPTLREKNLPKVIDNARFLILPWIRIPNLASHILSIVCRQLIEDWTARYHITPPVDRNVRGDAALHWRHLQSLRMDPCRHHPGTRTVRPAQEIRQAEKNHLAAAPAQRLETDAQPLTPTTRSAAHTHPLPCTRRNGENRHPTTRHPLRTERLPIHRPGRAQSCPVRFATVPV